MSKKIRRRMKWGIRKNLVKNIVAVSCLCFVIFIFLNYYDNCSSFNAFPVFMEPDRCKPGIITKEKLNATFITATFSSNSAVSLARKGINSRDVVASAGEMQAAVSSVNLQKRKLPFSTNIVETETEFPLEMIFEERKEMAQNACKDMLNLALAKENEGAGAEANVEENESKEHIEFSVGPRGRRLPKKTFYNQDMLQIMRLRNKPKYFRSTVGIKKNRWIHFHRIIKSPISPAENKVVEIKWCPIFKAASTPWLAVFTKLSKALTNTTEAQIKRGKLGFMELARMFRLLTPRIYEKNVRVTKYSMVIARHPFKRLLSAYRDKIERVKGRLYYYNKYSVKILSKYRKSDGAVERKSKDKDYALKVPTFQEFVRYVLSTEPRKLDEHWRPMYLDCNPCYRTFDFILKVETLNDDKDRVMQYLHVSPSDSQYKEVEDVWVRWNNPSGKNGPNRNESFYYSQLSRKDIQKLYQLYEPDFQIFDYVADDYFAMGQEYIEQKN